jgi:type VI secretion system protein ImpA
MASEEIIPLDQLLTPIAEESSVGRDIRDDGGQESLYRAIKDARISARSAERKNLFDSDTSEADAQWRIIIELAPDILLNHTKDLEIACWFTEALVRRYGFQGLRDGFKLIEGLIESYWDGLYPLPDEDGVETRVASLTGLNGEGAEGVLITPIRNVPLTEGSHPGPFNYWKYQQIVEIEKIIDEETKSERASKLGFNMDDVDRAVTDSSESFFVNIIDDLSDAIRTYSRIGSLLDQHCGINDSPPTSNIINILEACLGIVRHIGKYKIPELQNDANERGDESTTDKDLKTIEDQIKSSTGLVRTRDDAFKQLLEISQFFRKTEPHSPVSYMLERVVKWGDLPLDSLIRELIPDSSARDYYGSLTGIRTDDD